MHHIAPGLAVKVSLDDQTDPRFRPGMVARCSIRRARISDALVVPVEAVHADERGSFAWVSSALGSPAVCRIEVGRSTARFVEVRAGLKEGERVRLTVDD
jgi:multidrug efflux pump subunit AcrA (membrane-fusion protein)